MKSPAEADYLARALEVAIHLAVIAFIVLGAFWMFSPFVMVVLWAIVLAVTFYPLYGAIRNVVGGRRKLAGTFFIVLSLAVVLVPVGLLTSSLVDAVVVARQQAEAGTLVIPAPTDEVKDWPVIGERVYEIWQNASVDLQNTAQKFQPQIRSLARKIMSGAGDLAGALGQTVLAIIIAGVLMINADASARAARSIATKLGGDRGPPMLDLSVATIRSVVKGVVLVALIQALLAAAGLAMARVPFVGLWALLVMMLAVVQLPPILILGPIIPWVFAHNESIWVSVLFTVWSVVVSASDPFFKMLLLGRGLAVPMLIVLAGAIGGMIRAGMIGFFVGPVLLAIFYQLFTAWLRQDGPDDADPAVTGSSS
ncbi:MAG: AI-2E family transporter [Polyangiales bacterium]